MAELYEYTDPDGDLLRVTRDEAHGYVSVSKPQGPASVYAPTGEESVKFARAALAAGGDTGHEVFSSEELAQLRRERPLRDSDLVQAPLRTRLKYAWRVLCG